MKREIPPLKARPETIPSVLKMIEENQGNFSEMEEAITNYWRKISDRRKEPSKRNSLRAVFGPTLRHLQLVRGEGNGIKLLPKAKELLALYEEVGENAFKQKLAAHLLRLEETRWINLLFELRELDQPTIVSVLTYLKQNYPDSKIDKTKLRKYLSYWEYVGLIALSRNFFTLRKPLYESLISQSKVEMSEIEFKEILFESYSQLKAKRKSSYVPIPEVRDAVCEVKSIWPDQFDQLLREIPKETPEYLIYLSQPMVRESGGIRFGDNYFYFIAIYTKGEDK